MGCGENCILPLWSSSPSHTVPGQLWGKHQTNPSCWTVCKISDQNSSELLRSSQRKSEKLTESKKTAKKKKKNQPRKAWGDLLTKCSVALSMGSWNKKKGYLKAKEIWLKSGFQLIIMQQSFPGGSVVNGFDFWSGKIPHALEHERPCIATVEPVL